jgi:GH25 family lysozyme M1 (1,4-beta-N-acetylmuramidase)
VSAIISSLIEKADEARAAARVPLEFIDISAANGRVDFARIKAAGIHGVWFHALEGNEDPAVATAKLLPEVNAARAAGLLTGAYQEVYPRHDRPSDADVQARQLAEVHHALGCELLPWGVHEDVRQDAIHLDAAGRARCVSCARLHRSALAAALEREGILYTGPGYWDLVSQGLDVADFADALLVVADYEPRSAPRLPRGFARALLWQYAGGAGVIGHVDGVAGAVDRTVLLGSIETLRA